MPDYSIPYEPLREVPLELAELSLQAVEFVQAAALVGEPFTLQEVARVQSVTALSMLLALEETITAGVIGIKGHRLVFRSPGLRRKLNTRISVPLRKVLLRGAPPHRSPAPAAIAPATEARPKPPASGERPMPVGRMAEQAPESLVSALLLCREDPGRPLDPHTEIALSRTLNEAPAPADGAVGGDADAAEILALFVPDETKQRDRAKAIVATRRRSAVSVVAALVLANLDWAAGRVDQALEWGHEALRMDQDALPVAWRPYPPLVLAVMLVHLGRFTEGEAHLARARELAERLEHPWALAESSIVRGRLLMGTGRTEKAEAEIRAGVAGAQRVDAHLTAAQGISLLSLMTLAQGHWSEAVDQFWRARSEIVAQPGALRPVRHDWADFRVTTAGMDAAMAVELLVKRFPDLLTKASVLLLDAGVAAHLVRLCRAAGEKTLATAITRRVARLADQNAGHQGLAAEAGHAWGLLHQDADALEYAALQHSVPWAAAAASEDLGTVLLERWEDGSAARRHLGTALEGYRAIGALASVTRVESLLRKAGSDGPQGAGKTVSTPVPASVTVTGQGRRPYRPSGSRTRSGLTEIEHRIARLVAEGLTNQQVANRVSRSPHTINFHLRQIYRKLDVDSRVKLARVLH
ncbi:hypothetical protein GPA10_24380 [Streptomyces sp. p1417]|uniref:HTH luxR-type domain-containing protein n=1 Tax=Streptomyces typhae TaxID=2681492 RepID=A0A6L6X2E3_9ACTN|nr:LuxR family transcriptional regulator [Streptomyces typhae]MVO87810.1 hypothetical protein [Streptomyces typhae]